VAISDESQQESPKKEEEKVERFLGIGLKPALKQETKYGASP